MGGSVCEGHDKASVHGSCIQGRPYTGFKKIIFKQKALRGYLFES
jgi:hypothetical protein